MFRKSRESTLRKRLHRSLKAENLNERVALAADAGFFQEPITTTPAEQMVIELINRARANPSEEAARLGIDLNSNLPANSISAEPKTPLVPNESLLEASRAHSTDMLIREFFAHTNPDGETPSDRAATAGYTFGTGENIAYSFQKEIDQDSLEAAHAQLFGSALHRQNLLNESYDDIGVGFALAPAVNVFGGPLYTTEMFGLGDSSVAITGVVYSDNIIEDNFYSVGEGWGEIMIQATDSQGRVYQTVTNEAGGYKLNLPRGRYEILANHSQGSVTQPRSIEVGAENIKLDFSSDQFAEPNLITGSNKDVNGDNVISGLDALLIINRINSAGTYDVIYDVNGDGRVTPLDALVVINAVNLPTVEIAPASEQTIGGEGDVLSSNPLIINPRNTVTTGENVSEELATAVAHAKAVVGSWLNVSVRDIEVESISLVAFEDSELAAPGQIARQALTEGYEVILRYRTAMYVFRGTEGVPPRFVQYASINDYIKDDAEYCCPWQSFSQHCLDAIDAAIEDLAKGIAF